MSVRLNSAFFPSYSLQNIAVVKAIIGYVQITMREPSIMFTKQMAKFVSHSKPNIAHHIDEVLTRPKARLSGLTND